MTLAGHTHGGTLSLHRGLSLGRLETPYVSGWYEKPGGQLYVNRGIGTTGPPIRLGARPEITVLEFVSNVTFSLLLICRRVFVHWRAIILLLALALATFLIVQPISSICSSLPCF